MNPSTESRRSTGSPALERAHVIVGHDDRIVAWTAAAERLLGHRREAVAGMSLHEVLDVRDVYGNRCCTCWLRGMLRHGEPIAPFLLDARNGRGGRISVVVQVTPVELPHGGWTYCFLPERRRADRRRPAGPASAAAEAGRHAEVVRLTRREAEVLRLLASGASTGNIARALDIAGATARNHVQHLLDKLGAKSRLEAVVLARRHDLL